MSEIDRLRAINAQLLAALQRAERAIRTYTPSAKRECGLEAIRAAIAAAQQEAQ